ncbi:MAG TPA: Nramp family divalent metal transporter, partial [Actinomycetales bacterium]
NVTAGANHGYLLCWVVVVSSAMAMLVQHLSAKLGLATGATLPQHCNTRYRKPVARLLWLQAEAVSLATELAEVLGGALALHLLLGMPLAWGALATGVGSMIVLAIQSRHRQRRFEAVVTVMLAVCGTGFVVNAVRAGPSPAEVLGGIVPRLQGTDSLLLAAGILGATVMPHAIYLHSALVCDRFGIDGPAASLSELRQRARWIHASSRQIVVALGLAATVNLSLVLVAAAALRGREADTIEGAYAAIGQVLGPVAAGMFALALLASGLASSTVGAYAGSVVLQGFCNVRIPTVVRRMLTLAPALAIVAAGVEPTRALILSQVVLTFGLPFALWPLIRLTSDRAVMGVFTNARATTAVAATCTAAVSALGLVLLTLTFT